MDENTITFQSEVSGERLDKLVLAQLPQFSRVQVQTMIKDGFVTVDDKIVKAGAKLKGGEIIRVTIPDIAETTIEAEQIFLNIIFEDPDFAVIDKPAGMVIHPGVGNETSTLVHALLYQYPEIAEMESERMGIVHRLDKDTSGLVVVARNALALEDLMGQFHDRTVEKVYLALVERSPKTRTGTIDAPIGRDPKNRKQMSVLRDGKPAVTEFTVIDDNFKQGQALLKLQLKTGRTHQARVHMAFIGCPIVGDRVYGFRKQRIKLKRQFLHAAELTINHPRTGERLEFHSNLPNGLQNILEKLRD